MKKLGSLFALGIVLFAQPLSAISFSYCDDDINGTFDTNLSFGIGIRASKIESNLVGGPNNNYDDGDLNYEKGDLYATAFKGVWELTTNYKKDNRLFVRADAIYDPLIMYSHPRRTKYSDTAKHILGRRLQLLDCNFAHRRNICDMVFTFKIGNQAMNWGESTFIQNGLNSINPIDVAKIRSPGNQIKTALLPIWSVRVDVQFNQHWSAFAWWQWHWKRTQLDPKGTFFSTTDTLSPGSFFVCLAPTPPASDTDPESTYTFFPPTNPFLGRRDSERGCNEQNFGASIQWTPPDFNETQLAIYGAIYASRLPIFAGFRGDLSVVVIPNLPPFIFPNFATTKYLIQYPNHIGLLGASFNTMVGDVALQGEYSLHMGQPLQLNPGTVIFSSVPGSGGVFDYSQAPGSFFEVVNGYVRRSYSQAQVSATYNSGKIFGADSSVLVGEIGICRVHNWPKGLIRYVNSRNTVTAKSSPLSAGYTIVFIPTYNNVFYSFSLTPNFAFSHGFFGNTPTPLSTFTKNNYRYTFGLTADYLRKVQIDFAYTLNYGGTLFNKIRDRHFAQLSTTYSF